MRRAIGKLDAMARRQLSHRAKGDERPSRGRPRLRLSVALIAAASVALVLVAMVADRGGIRPDERIVLFPTAAHLSGDGRLWEVPVHGWVFEPEVDDALRGAALALLRKTLKDDLATVSPLLEQRLRPFLVDNQRAKRVVVHVAGVQEVMEPTDEHGHFTGLVRVPVAEAKRHAQQGSLVVEARSDSHAVGTFRGSARLVGPTGLSVVSDIDDTIKISQVRDRNALIRNTLLNPFRATPGMADLYRTWAKQGVEFHYLSGSPWQLYGPLTEFMAEQGFPVAEVSLKSFRLKDSTVLKLFADPVKTKLPALEQLFRTYPRRRFCLVGDSGEKDPEVYALVARRHPAQIACIYIRNVTDEDPDGPRFRDVFRSIDRDRWRVFTDPSTLPAPT